MEQTKISISASFADCIRRIEYYKNAQPTSTKQVIKNNSHDKESIIELFETCISFEILDGEIEFTVNKGKIEIQTKLNEYKNMVISNIKSLAKWCNTKPEWNTEIINYLKYKDLEWIIQELKPHIN